MVMEMNVWVAYDPKTNEKVAEYPMSVKQLCKNLGYNMNSLYNAVYGERTYKGYMWKKEIITKEV